MKKPEPEKKPIEKQVYAENNNLEAHIISEMLRI